jgi:hypothetical protein
MGLGIRVRDADIDNGVGAVGKKTTEEEVAAIAITLARVGVGNVLN